MRGRKTRIIVVGSGHLAATASRTFLERGFAVRHITGDSIRLASQDASGPSLLEHLERELTKAGVGSAEAVLVLDDHDSYNIRFALAAAAVVKTAPIIVSLFNDAIASQLQAAHENLRAVSPAKVAAPTFAEAVQSARAASGALPATNVSSRRATSHFRRPHDWMLITMGVSFVSLMAASILFFRWSQGLGWLDAFYFVSTIVSTVGFGDISLSGAAPIAKFYGSVLMLVSVGGVWMTFSLVIDRLVRRRAELELGRKRYNYDGHVIVCGLGRIGYAVAEELHHRGERVVVVQTDNGSRFVESVRAHGIEVYIGDARLPKTMFDVGADKAAAVISVVNADESNLEICLNARTLREDLPIVLRVFDRELAASVRERLSIPSFSTSAIMAEHLVSLVRKPEH